MSQVTKGAVKLEQAIQLVVDLAYGLLLTSACALAVAGCLAIAEGLAYKQSKRVK